MDLSPPRAVREKVSHLSEGLSSYVIVYEREFSPEEIARFRALPADVEPQPARFAVDGRLVRFECLAEEEARWRLALEIFLVKAFRPSRPTRSTSDTDVRRRMGLRPLQR